MVNQIDEPSELNAGLLQTPVPAKGGKAKKSSRSVKANAGEFWTEMLCVSYLPTQTTVSRNHKCLFTYMWWSYELNLSLLVSSNNCGLTVT